MKRAVVVQDDLLPGIQSDLDILVEDWEQEGAEEVVVLAHPRGIHLNPSTIRGQLQAIDNLEGALLLGELPVVRMNHSTGQPFESDYYFMELVGNWQIAEKNIVTSQEDLQPTVSVGRVLLAPDTGWRDGGRPTEIGFYNRYLEKLHNFRIGSRETTIRIGNFILPFPPSSIVIPPKGRFEFSGLIVNNLDDPDIRRSIFEHLYPAENITDYEFVTNDEYASILVNGEYDSLWILAHSTPGGQRLANGTKWNQCDYYDARARINFFFFEACSAGAIVWEDLGDPLNPGMLKTISDTFSANILFAPDHGVIVIAASMQGAFGNCTQFFDILSTGGAFGDAFKDWMGNQILTGWPQGDNYMILFGDPFIRFGAYKATHNCIIRTSLAGTDHEKHLPTLHHYRNQVLSKTWAGRMVIWVVYSVSALLGNTAQRSKVVRFLVKRVVQTMMALIPREGQRKDRKDSKASGRNSQNTD